jgi:hypothetical protein
VRLRRASDIRALPNETPTPVVAAAAPVQVASPPAEAVVSGQRPVWVVVVLTVLTFGWYWLVWFGISWAEMKRALRNDRMQPFWHAFSLIVPIYSLFQIYAHYRTLDNLALQAGSTTRLNPWMALGALFVSGALTGFGSSIAAASPEAAPVGAVASLAGLALALWVPGHGQAALNAIWRARADREVPSRISGGEIATLLVCVILWALLALLVVAAPPEFEFSTY